MSTFPISACILTHNEEDRLPATLAALSGRVSEIVLLDAESTDTTVAVGNSYGAKITVAPWAGFVAARRRLLELATQEWVLMLDADEVLETAFWDELHQHGFPNVPWSGARVRRRTMYLGRRMRYAWQPDWKRILFRKQDAAVTGGSVHEEIQIDGRLVTLQAELDHYSYRSVADHYHRILRYAELGSRDLLRDGRRVGWSDLVLRPAWAWFRHLILKRSFLDGVRGWMTATSAAISTYLRFARAFERQRQADKPDSTAEHKP